MLSHVRVPLFAVACALTAAASLSAQVSTNSLFIGGLGAIGCQGTEDPPTLSGGVPASAEYDVTYDPATRRMTLTVTNTSPVVPGEFNPLLTRIYLNTPPGALTHVRLIQQSAAGGAQPDFDLDFGEERAGCLGKFELKLETEHGVNGGIANANAPQVGGPPGRAVIGPATFVIELIGPGAANLHARALTYGFSEDCSGEPVHAAAKFQAGGTHADESGWISSAVRVPDCATSMWLIGEPRVGTTVTFCRNGQSGCHDCMWVSLFPGPTSVGGITAPIGFPLLAVLDGNVFTGLPLCFPLAIPDDPNLSGVPVYFVLATTDQNAPSGIPTFSFGDVFTVRLL